MSSWRMMRSLNRCCLEKVDLLVAAGGAAEMLPVSSIAPCHSWGQTTLHC
jgi:hypothetical protein